MSQNAMPESATRSGRRESQLANANANAPGGAARGNATSNVKPLFRDEAVQAIRPQQQGAIILVPGRASRWWALAGLSLVLALALLIALGSYTRRSTVSGQLMPSEGLIRVTAAYPGVVTELHVREGQSVRRGDVLAVLSGDRGGPQGDGFQSDMAGKIEARRQLLQQELDRLALAEPVELKQWQLRIASMQTELEQVRRQAQQLQQRISGAQESVRRYDSLSRQGLLSREELINKQADLTELNIRSQGNLREALTLQRDTATAQREQDTVRARYAAQQSELQRAVLSAGQEFTELESRRRIVVAAPADGQITLLQAEFGQSIDPARALAHIVPAGALLVAKLYAPSRAAGFVRPGEPVLLRVEAFPYQKYGQQAGRVAAVSAAAVGTAEIQGFVARPEWSGEPLFAITVQISAQAVPNGAHPLPLQTGMRVEADVLHETRRLYEWILEPLYAARSRVAST